MGVNPQHSIMAIVFRAAERLSWSTRCSRKRSSKVTIRKWSCAPDFAAGRTHRDRDRRHGAAAPAHQSPAMGLRGLLLLGRGLVPQHLRCHGVWQCLAWHPREPGVRHSAAHHGGGIPAHVRGGRGARGIDALACVISWASLLVRLGVRQRAAATFLVAAAIFAYLFSVLGATLACSGSAPPGPFALRASAPALPGGHGSPGRHLHRRRLPAVGGARYSAGGHRAHPGLPVHPLAVHPALSPARPLRIDRDVWAC